MMLFLQIDDRLLMFRSAMKRMAVSNVLIVGVQGLGVEIGESNYLNRSGNLF